MLQLILLRPGATDFDQHDRIEGTLDVPLTESGRKDAEQAAEKLRPYLPAAVYCSPRRSAHDTAAIIASAFSLKPKSLKNLHNMKLGLWQGMLVDDVRHKQPKVYKQWQEHPESVRPPEGEIIPEATERVKEGLEKLARKHRGETIVLVAPEPLASLVRQVVEGTPLGDLWKATNGCDRFEVLNVQPAAATNGAHPASKPRAAATGLDTTAPKRTIADSR